MLAWAEGEKGGLREDVAKQKLIYIIYKSH